MQQVTIYYDVITDMVVATNLETPRLILKPIEPSDIADIYEIAKEKKSIEDFQYVAHSLNDVQAWLAPSLQSPASLIWTIRKKENTIGLFEVYLEAEYSSVETNVCRVGYFLDFREHNQGYATEALLAVIDWLFTNTPIERIEAGVTLHNVPSYRVLEKAGFIRDHVIAGNWKWYDKVYDSAYYYLLKHLSSKTFK